MNLVELNISLPSIVEEIYEKMEELSKGKYFCIAGGCISNTYMNLPIRDVDIFFSFETTTEEVEKIFGVKTEAQYRWDPNFEYEGIEIPFLFRFTYKGMKVEIIQTQKERVLEFDLRFRQFYYYKKKVWATKEALEDIKNKEIVVVNPATPISTFFRLHRFKEQLDFTINEKSFRYTLWSFNQINLKQEKALKYIEKNAHKISPELKEKLTHFFNQHVKRERDYYSDEMENFIHINDIEFPYHKNVEHLVSYELRKPNACMAIHHHALESYQAEMEKELTLDVPYKYYETTIGKFVNKLKKFRTRYILTENHFAHPYPNIKKEQLSTKFKEYLNNQFLQKMANEFNSSKEPENWSFGNMLYGVRPIPDKLTIRLSTREIMNSMFTYGDLLHENIVKMTILTGDNMNMYFYLRKCDNGKYTVSGFMRETPDGSGFYIDIIGKALKEQYEHLFDFYNDELKGIYSYHYYGQKMEYYFDEPVYNLNYLDHHKREYLMPIKFPKKEAL